MCTRKLLLVIFALGPMHGYAQESGPRDIAGPQSANVSPLWKAFQQAKGEERSKGIPDFSYAGYHFSEKAVPDVSGRKKFNVTDYGAIPDDDRYDDDAIQAAIRDAEKNPGGGVVFFPPGKYIIAPDESPEKRISITHSNIVLKGSGSGAGGTEIYQDKMRLNNRQFLFKPEKMESRTLTTIAADVPRESFWVEVADASALKPGQDVVIRHRSEAFTRQYFAPLALKEQWTRLFGPKGGMLIFEIHTIEKIDDKKVKFVNPLHFDLRIVPDYPFELANFTPIEECGVEDILFSSNWKNYPEDFVHHKNAIHDYAWEAVGFEYVKNSWVRNCVFRDWNEGIFIRSGYQMTVENLTFEGKKGHASVHARTGYGVLIKNCRFNGAQHHGPGVGYSASGTVITGCSLGVDQNIDSHSGQPMATLFDDIDGGVFYNLGGPEQGHPHHGRDLVFWNFYHRSGKDQSYDFWDMSRRRNYTIAKPVFAGFRSDHPVGLSNYGVNESQGKAVWPRSLFQAQLEWRLRSK